MTAAVLRSAALLIAVVTIVAGCAGAPSPADDGLVGAGGGPTPEESIAQSAPVVVGVGDSFEVVGPVGADMKPVVLADVTITDIEVDPDCSTADVRPTNPVAVPVNGHFIAVRMDVATTAAYDSAVFGAPSGYDFAVTGPDGYTSGGLYAVDGQRCLPDREVFTAAFAPSGRYRGWVVLDSPADEGVLTYRFHFAPVDGQIVSIPLPRKG